MKIVGTMIVLNNGDGEITKCLTAYKSVVHADRVFIVDGGSTDSTLSEIEKFNTMCGCNYVHVKHIPWADDFEIQRNNALDLIREWAFNDRLDENDIWCVACDGDDWYLTFPSPEQFMVIPADVGSINVWHHYVGRPVFHKNLSVWRLKGSRWNGMWHSWVTVPGKRITWDDAVCMHGWSKQHNVDPDRKLRIGQKAVIANPSSARYQWLHARDLLESNTGTPAEINLKLDRAMNCLTIYFYHPVSGRKASQDAHAAMLMAVCFARKENYDGVKEWTLKALSFKPDYSVALEALAWVSTKLPMPDTPFLNTTWESMLTNQ